MRVVTRDMMSRCYVPRGSDFTFLTGFSELLFLFHKMSGTHSSWLIATMMGKVEDEEEYEHRILDLYKRICQPGMDADVKASTILPSHVYLHRIPSTKFEFLVIDSQGKEMVCSVDSAEVVPPLLQIPFVAYMPTAALLSLLSRTRHHALLSLRNVQNNSYHRVIGAEVCVCSCMRAFVCVHTCGRTCACVCVYNEKVTSKRSHVCLNICTPSTTMRSHVCLRMTSAHQSPSTGARHMDTETHRSSSTAAAAECASMVAREESRCQHRGRSSRGGAPSSPRVCEETRANQHGVQAAIFRPVRGQVELLCQKASPHRPS